MSTNYRIYCADCKTSTDSLERNSHEAIDAVLEHREVILDLETKGFEVRLPGLRGVPWEFLVEHVRHTLQSRSEHVGDDEAAP